MLWYIPSYCKTIASETETVSMDLAKRRYEKMVQHGVAPEMMDIARTGEKALAKILDVTSRFKRKVYLL